MIIDIHGHYTTAPQELQDFRDAQLASLDDPTRPAPEVAQISDEALRESVERNQLRILRERGGDLMLLSPKASAMEHHVPDQSTATAWARASNDLVYRVAQLYPDSFAPVAQLPQTPGGELGPVIDELRRCVEELGFVGCNVNPDPAAGYWTTPPMTDEYWYPLYEAMVELDVPAMVHVSASCNPNFHSLGAHYLNADTSVFMQLVSDDLFDRFPALTLVIPHGGGAVPYHWGRYRGLAKRRSAAPTRRAAAQRLLRHLRLPPARHRPADGAAGEERAVRLRDARRRPRGGPGDRHRLGRHESSTSTGPGSPTGAAAVFEGNARRVYPRLIAAHRRGRGPMSRLQLTFAAATTTAPAPWRRADPARRHRPDLPAAAGRGDVLPDVRHREFDVAEMSLSSYVSRSTPTRRRSSRCRSTRPGSSGTPAIFVHADAGIEKPEDLRGKVVGTPEWQLTAGVWIRGILADHYGVPVDSVDYRTGGQETPGGSRRARSTCRISDRADPGRGDPVGDARRRRIDALQSPRVPSSFSPVATGRRLFADVARRSSTSPRPGSSRSCTWSSSAGTSTSGTRGWRSR